MVEVVVEHRVESMERHVANVHIVALEVVREVSNAIDFIKFEAVVQVVAQVVGVYWAF